MLPREKKYPEECQKAREETLALILDTLDKWKVGLQNIQYEKL